MRVCILPPFQIAATLLLVMVVGFTALAQNPASDLKRMTIEELMDVDVTSVSRANERLADTAAAVTVITAEDIRRSGATDIPEVLRFVPGLQVARFGAGSWAISARGFNSTAANKLLVMIDGRTVYSPLFSGTFWEVQDLMLADIARIEVVRGPGATLWGANAVNGVINIITKSTHQTKSNYAYLAGGGAEDLAVAAIRAGGAAGAQTSYRVFGKYFYRDQLSLPGGADSKDSVRIGRTGFRVDSTSGDNDITFEGEVYRGMAGILGREDAKVLGGDLVGRWNRKLSNRSELQLQTYFSRELRRVPLQSDFRQRTFDIDLQHRFLIARHAVTWGAEYRWNGDVTVRTPVLAFVPSERTYPLVSAFVQDEISLAADKVKLQFGSKFEHNDFNDFEIQPSVRALWSVRRSESIWGAVSRAVRTPTRFDSDIRFGPPGFQFVGSPDFKSESLVAFELGYRRQTAARLSLDVASFYNVYDSLRSLEFQPASGIVALLNNMNARTYGVEVSAAYDVMEDVRVTGGYTLLGKQMTLESGHLDVFNGSLEGNDPRHQFTLHGSADVTGGVELDSTFRFVSRLPAPAVPRYAELDARIGWTATSAMEVSLIGRNLLHRQHPEFGSLPNREEVQRNIYGRLAIRF
jgi:iron complex outermembrane recepter protein